MYFYLQLNKINEQAKWFFSMVHCKCDALRRGALCVFLLFCWLAFYFMCIFCTSIFLHFCCNFLVFFFFIFSTISMLHTLFLFVFNVHRQIRQICAVSIQYFLSCQVLLSFSFSLVDGFLI